MAEALGHWIGQVTQAVEPWISTQTDKGARWRQEVGDHLEEARVGIVCLTPENLDAPWIHFEAGALSKTKDARLCTFLLGMQPTDVKEPLAQFQATKADEDDIRTLIKDINRYIGEDGGRALPEKDVDEIFDLHWPRLKEKLRAISAQQVSEAPVREDREKLDEILEILRGQEQRMQQLEFYQSGLFVLPSGGGVPSGSYQPGPTQIFTTVPSTGIAASATPGKTFAITPPPPLRRRIAKRAEEILIEKEEDNSNRSKE
jgi:hypothetical protein